MKNLKFVALIVVPAMLLTLAACSARITSVNIAVPVSHSSGQIYLYGEQHAVAKILDKEFAQWDDYYHSKNMRHLFIEMHYYTTEFLNLWMKSDNDVILDEIYADWDGSQAQTPMSKSFTKRSKTHVLKRFFTGRMSGISMVRPEYAIYNILKAIN